jgi:hypothetical protein
MDVPPMNTVNSLKLGEAGRKLRSLSHLLEESSKPDIVPPDLEVIFQGLGILLKEIAAEVSLAAEVWAENE